MTTPLAGAALAAAENAQWCDLVCRAHGIATQRSAEAWWAQTRSPPLYPDAVTLLPSATASSVLACVDATSGCSVKDSFATLDLRAHGFRVLFEASWILAEPAKSEHSTPESGLNPQTSAVRIGDIVVDDPGVHRVTLESGGSAVLHLTTIDGAEVAGISNVVIAGDAEAVWHECLAVVAQLHPQATIVGYERGAALAAPLAAGWRVAGPLRVWLRD